MKFRIVGLCAALAAALVVGHALAQNKLEGDKGNGAKADGAAPPDMEEMMKRAKEAGTPGPAHKLLEAMAGEWNVESRWWMAPDAPPAESKGTSKKHWILGGRFLQEEFDGDMMGAPFQGVGCTGYDNMKKKYVGSWMDTMSTALFTSEGTADSAGKVITMVGMMDEPMSGERNKTYKFITRIVSPDKHIMEMHDVKLGDKSKMGEITYTRK